MGLIEESVSFVNVSLDETEGTDYLLDNVGDVVTATIKFRFDGDYVLATSALIDDPNGLSSLVVFPDATTIDGVIPDVRHLWTSKLAGFENVDEGDEITIKNPAGAVTHVRTVIEKIDDQLLLMDTSFGAANQVIFPVDTIVYVSTPMQAIEYSFGLIENQEPVNYFSKIDGSEQKSRAQGLSSTILSNTPMDQLGDKSYQYGTLEIKGNGIGDGAIDPQVSQAFIVTHTFVINPLSLADQNEDTKNEVKPDYFKGANCLKYVFAAELSRDLTDPNRKKEIIEFSTLGNTGFLGENFNAVPTNYAISNLVFRRANNDVNEAIELVTDQTIVEFTINNTVDSPFSSGDTKFVLNHWLMTTPEEEYRQPQFSGSVNLAKDRTLKQNFVFDRIVCELDTLSVTPDNLGGDEQVIIDCIVEYISDSRVNVTATIGMSLQAVAKIGAMSTREYVLSISTKDHALKRSESDKVTLPIDINSYFTDLTDPTMVQTEITFVDHPNSDVDAGTQTLTVRTDDDVVGVAKFALDRKDTTGFTREGIDIGFLQVKAQVIARKDADTFFVLDSFGRNLDIDASIIIAPNGTVPIIDIEQDRGFRTPADDLRKNVVVKRRTDLDIVSGVFNYECLFPFIFRWEDWAFLSGVNDEFYDESLPNNGFNHDWARYAASPNWNIFFQFTIVATKDGVPITYTTESQIFVEDYTEGTEWDTEEAKGYLVSNGLEITKGGQSGISLDEATRIEGDMTFNTTPVPSIGDLVMVLMVNVFEKDDFKAQYRISSLYDNTTTDNVWIGLAGILKATKDDSLSPLFRVKAELRTELLAEEQTFRFSWRFYDTRADLGVPFGKLMEDGTPKLTESGIIKEVE